MSELVWLSPRQKGGVSAEAVSKDAAGCSSMQRYPNWLQDTMAPDFLPVTSCVHKIAILRATQMMGLDMAFDHD